jgi:cell division transport system permease protein
MAFWNTTYRYLRRSPYQSLAILITMVLAMFVAGTFTLVALIAHSSLAYFESKPQAFAFFDQNLDADKVKEIQISLEKTGKLSQVKYISKEEALEIYREQNKDEPLLLEMVTAEILPASIEVSAVNARDLSELVEILRAYLPNSDIQFRSDIIETMVRITQAVRLAGGSVLVFQIVIMVMVVLLIIGMKISARREEIAILRLIGATSWYIRWPFLLEGIAYGLISATLAWGGLIFTLRVLDPTLMQFLIRLPIYPFPTWFLFLFLGGMGLAGVVIGLLGSFIAVWRYLR